MGDLNFTTSEIEKIIDGRRNSFRQDISDSLHTIGSPQAISANTEYLFTNDTLGRNDVVSPTYITSRWNTTDNKIAFPEELDSPTYVADGAFTFDPTVEAEGTATIRMYIDDTAPKVIRTIQLQYKGIASISGALMTWYLGSDVGYNAKADGVYFTLEFTAAGSLYGKSIIIYRT